MAAKDWEDTVMTEEQLEQVERAYLNEDFSVNCIRLSRGHTEDLSLKVAQAQAEITWKARDPEIKAARQAGIKEVVEWVKDIPMSGELYKEYVKKLKEWGIDTGESDYHESTIPRIPRGRR